MYCLPGFCSPGGRAYLNITLKKYLHVLLARFLLAGGRMAAEKLSVHYHLAHGHGAFTLSFLFFVFSSFFFFLFFFCDRPPLFFFVGGTKQVTDGGKGSLHAGYLEH